MKNIAYAGALVALLEYRHGRSSSELLDEKYRARRRRCANRITKRSQLGYDYAQEHFDCPLPFHLEKMDANGDKILIDGNTADGARLRLCRRDGRRLVSHHAGDSVMDAFKEFCEKYRKDPETGKNNYCILQAEDELAAIGMVIGASWNGARAFTSTAGPGISLMNELLGLAYYAEIPAVVIDVQRVGPPPACRRARSRAICWNAPTPRTATRNIFCCSRRIPPSAFEFAVEVLRSGRALPDPGLHAVRSRYRHERLGGAAPHLGRCLPPRPRPRADCRTSSKQLPKFQRYTPEDETHVAARTLPGVHPKGAFFTRGSGHNKFGGYTEIPDEYQEVMDRLLRKHKAAAKFVPAPIIASAPGRAVRHHHARRLRSGRARSAGHSGRARASPPITCASAASRSTRASRRSSTSTSSASSSSRIATRSCARC